MSDNRRPQPSYALHGYQPIIIDEDSLTGEDRRAAILASVDHPCDWMLYLTDQERQTLQQALEDSNKHKVTYFHTGELPERRELRFEAARLGTFRAHARNKYAGGRHVWLGDGTPPWKRSSN